VDDDRLVDEVGFVRVAVDRIENLLDFLLPVRVLFAGGLPIGEQGAKAFEQTLVERFEDFERGEQEGAGATGGASATMPCAG